LDDDIAGMIGRFLDGVEVTDETLAVDLIERVGPIPGFFLDKEHTRNWWKKEQYLPKAADCLTYPEWVKSGKKDCLDYAKARMEEILSTHEVSIHLTEEQDRKISDILEEAYAHYKSEGLIK
jgi:trimethylamine--corrinoid protein Co-methyltransferase